MRLWHEQVPSVFLLLHFWQRTLSAVYLGVAAGYGLLCMLLTSALASLDWDCLAAEAAERARPAEQPAPQPTLRTADGASAAQEEVAAAPAAQTIN